MFGGGYLNINIYKENSIIYCQSRREYQLKKRSFCKIKLSVQLDRFQLRPEHELNGIKVEFKRSNSKLIKLFFLQKRYYNRSGCNFYKNGLPVREGDWGCLKQAAIESRDIHISKMCRRYSVLPIRDSQCAGRPMIQVSGTDTTK